MRNTTRKNRKSSHFSPYFIKRLSSWLVLSTALTLATPSESHAATQIWNPLNATWENGGASTNWDAAVAWTNGNDALFDGTGVAFQAVSIVAAGVNANSLTFDVAGYSIGGAGTLTLSGASTITTNADATISSAIAGTGLFKNGTGVLTLSGVNTIAGTVLADGTLQLGSATAFLSGSTLTLGLPDANNVTFDLNTFDATVGSISSNNAGGTKTITNTGGTLSTFTINNAAATNLGGIFTGTNLKLSQTGAALLTLTAANSYGGGTDITGTGGVLITDLGALGTGAAAIGTGSQLDINTAGGPLSNAFTLNGGTLRQSAANQVTATGLITVNSASTINVALANPGKLFISGGFSGVGDLAKNGNGILQITVASPTYSGNWAINAGQTEAQIAGALGTGGVTVNTGGELVASNALIGNNVTIGGVGAVLSFDNGGAGDFRGTLNAAQNFTVILKDFYSPTARNGTISGVISGAGNMAVTGAAPTTTTVSSLLLTGNNPAYTGTITPAAGVQVRAIQGATQDGLGAAAVVLGGSTLGITPQLTAAGGTAGFKGSYYYGGAVLGTSVGFTNNITDGVIGGYDFGASGTGAVRVADATRVDATIATANMIGTLPAGFVPTGGVGAPANFGVLWTGILNIATGGNYTFNTASDDGSLLYVDGEPVVLNDFAQGITTRTGTIQLPAGFHSVIVKVGQGIGGVGITANYSGPDTANTLVNIGSIGGTVTSNAGILFGAGTTIDNNISLTAATTSGIDISGTTATNTGTLTFGAGANLNLTGQTGSETFNQNGAVTLNGVNFVQVGPVQVVSNPGNQRNQSSGADLTISGAIGEAAAGSNLIKYGPRNVTLSGTNTYTGATYYTGGTLLSLSAAGGNAIPGNLTLNPIFITGVVLTAREFANNQIADTGVVTLAGYSGVAGSNLDLNGFNDTIGGFVFVNNQGTGTETVSTGAGTLTLNGNVLVTGTSTGASQFTGNLNLGGATRTFTTFGLGAPTIGAVVTNGSITKAGLGSLLISGANPGYAGLTTINAGKLSVSNAGALGTTATPGVDTTLVNSGGYLDIVGGITVAEALTLNGRGQPVFVTTGANGGSMYSGALQGSGGAITGVESGLITLGSNVSIGVVKGTALTLSNVISDGGSAFSLTKTQGDGTTGGAPATIGAGGTLVLTGVNTYTGATTIEAGELRLQSAGQAIASTVVNIGTGSNNQATLTLGASNQMPSSVVLNFNNTSQNAKFQLNGFNQTVRGFSADTGVNGIIQNFETGGAGTSTLTVNTAGVDTAFNGRMRDQTGVLALTKTGAGTLTLSGINSQGGTNIITYTGATAVNQGTLKLTDATGFTSPITLSGTGALEFNYNYGRNLTYSKVLVDGALGFTKTGLGNVALTGASPAATGTVNVNAGALVIQGAIGASTVLPNAPINVAAGAQLNLFGAAGATTYNNVVTLNGLTPGGALAGAVSGGTIDNTLLGQLNLNGVGMNNISTGWSDKTFRITGKITGAGGLQFDKLLYTQQPPVFQINNALNDWAGGTTINAGTVYFTAGLPATGNLNFGGYFTQSTLTGAAGAINILSGSNIVLGTNGLAGFTRAVGTGAGQVSFTGEGGGFSAVGSAQTVNFGGASGSVDWGAAGFNAGASLFFNDSNTLAGASAFNADNTVTVTNDFVLSTGGMRRIYVADNNATTNDQVNFSGAISGPGGLIKDGGNSAAYTATNGPGNIQGRLILSGGTANTYAGVTTVVAGTLALNKTATFNAIGGDLQIGGLQNNSTRRIVYLGANEQIPDTATVSLIGSNANNGDLRLFGFNETVASIQDRSGGGVIEISEVGDTGFLGVAINNTLSSTLTVGGTNADSFYNGFLRTQSGGTGVLNLVKNGIGTLTISQGQQSGAGNASYNGTTTLNGGTLQYSNIGTYNSAVTTAASTSVVFNTNINQSFTDGQTINGSATVQKIGIGTMILGGANGYSGLTTVNGGILQITGAPTGTAGFTVSSGGTLVVGNATTAGAIQNAGNITVNSGGTVGFSRNDGYTYSGVISGAGNVDSRAGGTATILSGANAFSGATTVYANSSLTLAGSGASVGGLTVNTGGTLTLDFTQAGSNVAGIVDATALVNLNGGTLAITGSGVANTQTLGAVTLGTALPGGQATLIGLGGLTPTQPGLGASNINLTSGAGGLNVTLGLITHTTGATANFILPALGTVTTAGVATGGIANGFTTTSTGTTWLAEDGGGVLTALAAYGADIYGAGVNTDVVAGGAGVSSNSLRFNTAAPATVTFAGANTVTTGGILVTSAVGANTSTITGGTLAGSATSGLTLIQNNPTGGLTIGSGIVDNGGATGLTKAGTGTVTLTGSNTYSGATYVSQGTLITSGTTGSGAVSVASTAVLQIGDNTTNGIIPTNLTSNGIVVIANGTAQTDSAAFNAASSFNFLTNALSNGTSFQTGVFTKTGAGTLTITSPILGNQFHQRAGTTVLDTGANVQIGGTNPSATPYNSIGQLGGDVATLTVKGAGKITQSGDFNVSDVSVSRGTLNLQDQGVVITGNFFVGKTGTSVGVVNQTLGSLSNTGGSNDWRIGGNGTAGADTGAYGIYNLSAGTFQTARNFQIGASGLGVFNQTGGAASVTGGFNVIGRFNGSGLLNITGGTYTDSSGSNTLVGEFGTAVMNVGVATGSTLVSYSAGQYFKTSTAATLGIGSNNTGVGTGSVNLSYGGLINASGVFDVNFNNTVANSPSYLNFHGGILQGRVASTAALPFLGGFRAINTNASAAFNGTLTAATVWSEGAIIDTNSFALSLPQTLVAPSGNGVSAIATGAGGSGYAGEPIVVFTGGTLAAGGSPATARAVVSGGVITGYVITNPGSYTVVPTGITLSGGGGTGATPGALTTPANATTGGLTKLSTGVLTMTSTGGVTTGTTIGTPNTYLGPTAVNGGTLLLDYSAWNTTAPTNMINAASVLQLGGGTLTVQAHPTVAAAPTGLTGTWTSGGNTILLSAANASVVVGQTITGTNIPAASVVTSVNGTTITISAVTTGAGAAAGLTFGTFTGTAAAQTFASTTLNAGGNAVVSNLNSGAGATVTLGAITRNSGSAADFSGTGTINTLTANTGTTILGGWATQGGGANWAISAGNGVVPGNITAFGAYTNDTWVAANNTTVTVASTQTNVTTNSVRFNANTAFTVTIAGTDVITTGGVLITPTDTTAATIFTGGTLNSGGGDLIFNHFGTGVKTVASAIGAATTGLVKSGGGILTLSSPTTTNVYTGNTTIGAGTLRIGVTEQIPNASSVTIAAGASLDLNNLGETINGLSGYGSVVNSVAGTPTLNVGSGGASSTFSGLIVNGTGNVAINKTGAGTLTLNNVVAGSFTGATTISAGAIDIATPLALANNTTINVNAAGGLLFDTTIPTISGLGGNATFALQTTGTAAVPNAPVQLSVGNNNSIATYSGALTGSGTIVKIGNGAQFLAGNNTSTGGVIANNGALVLSGNNTGASGPMIASGGIIQINTSTSFIGAGNVVVATGGTVAFGAVTANPAVVGFGTISSGMNRIDPNSTGVLAVQTDGSLQTPVTENLDFSSAGPGGALNLSLGATMIAATNAGNAPVQYTGVITPNANIFRIGGGGGRLILSNGATLAGANSLFLYGGGTGGGVGNERLFLTAAYGFTGSTTVNAGVTLINTLANGGSASSLGAAGTAASNLVLNGGTLQYIGSGSSTNRLFTISTAPTGLDSSGTGPVNFTGTGAVAFLNSGNRTFTLQGNNTGANTLAAAIGDSVNIAGTSGVLANGTTAITKGGNGTWFLSGANTFSGGVTVNNGVLGFNNLAAIGANTVNGPATVLVNSGGAVALGGSLTTGIQATLNRISPLSTGTVALTANSSENISFDGGSAGAGLPQVTLGAYGSVNYTGTLTPFGTQYRLGGGGGVLTIAGGGLTGPRVLTIGGGGPGASFVSNPNLNGAVVLGGISDYTGGTVLATGGILSATSLTALGTGPLKFQGGFYRAVDTTDITLASDGVSARDIRLGLDSNAASATANIEVVSGVNVTFSKALGALPTFGSNEAQVTLTKFGAGTLTLAGGLNLALSAGGGTTNAGLLIIERGTLSITSNPTFYNGNIQVGSNAGGVGTLKLGANNVFGTGTVAAQGSVIDVYSGSNIDLNGFSDSVRIVRGMGNIINSGVSTANLTVGTNSEAEILGGNLSGNFTLTVGGNQTFTFGGSGNVNGLELWNTNSTGFTGKLVVNAGALRVRADGAIGSTTETFAANKITLNNGGVLINGTTLFHPVVIGANHGITIGATGGTISVGGTSAMVINSPITGSGMLTIGDETGTVFLAGNNTYTGGTTISSANTRGFLSIGAGGTTGNLPAGDFLFNTAAGGGRLYFFRSNNMTVPNNINGPGFLLQIGAGTTTLTGNTTTFNSVFVGGGRLKADFSGGNSPISTGATPSVSAGTLEYVGPTGDNTFRLGALTATAFGTPANFNGGVTGDAAVQSTYGGSGIQQLIFNGNARGTAAVTMNFITSGGVNGVTNSIMFEQGPNPKNVIGAAFYFNGADFAAVDLAGFVRAADYGNDNNTNALNSLATVNRFSKLTTSLTTTGLGYSGIVLSGAGTNLTISNAANLTLNANPGALLKSGGGTSIVGGVVGANVSNNNQELILRADTAGDTLQIDLPIIGTGALTKSGNGQLTLTAPNTYTGTTMINQGSVLVTGIGAINLGATGSEIRLAAAAGETAILTIDSAAAVIATGSTANSLRVGEAGSGTLNQSAGSVTAARYLSIGENLGSTGAYNMTGGTLTVKTDNTSNGAALIVGRAGTGSLSIGAGSTVNVNLGAQIQLGTGAVNPGQFQGLIPNVGITTGVGSILQTGGNVNVAVSNGNYQSNVVGGVILGVDGTGSYTLNGGTLTTPALGRGNGLATFTLGSGTLKGAATTSVVPQAIFNVDLPIALTGTGAGRGLIDTSGNDSTFTGALTGVGGFVKASGGALNVLGNGSNYGGGTDITGGSVVSSGTSLGTGNVNVGTGTTLAVQGVQQGLFSKWVLGVPTTVTPGVTTGNTGMVTEFTSLANFNNYLAGKPLVAVESTTARGKVAVNYLEDGVPNGTTAIPPAIVAINNGNNPFIASLGGKFNAAIAGDYTFQLRSDDASAMWIDGNPVLDNNRGQGVTTRTGTITLSAGLHDITIGWANTGGGQGFSAGVTLPGQGQSFTIGNELNLSNDLLSYGSNDLTVGSLSGVAGGSVTFAGGLFTTGGDGTSTGFAGVISNAGNFKKVGAGIQSLSGANTFTGTVTISGGTLNANANAALGNVANTVTIENTAVLQAGGTFATNRTVILGPGGGGKIDTNGNTLTLDTGSTVTGTALEKTGAGVLNIKGVQTYSSLTTTAGVTNIYTALGTGTSTIAANATLNIYANQTLASLTIADGIEVTFGDGLPFGDEGGKSGGFTAAFSPPSGGVSGGSSPGGSAVVPEPGSFALLLTGALGLLGRRRRKNN